MPGLYRQLFTTLATTLPGIRGSQQCGRSGFTLQLRRELSFIDLTARMGLRADAAVFYLGYLWWVLEPLVFVGIFYFVFGILLESPRADFLAFLIVGKLPFQWFSGSLSGSATAIIQGQQLIAQSPVPKALLVLSRVQQTSYKQLAVFGLLFTYLFATGVPVATSWLWLPIVLFAQYLLITASSLGAAILVCVARDFTKLIQLFIIAMMFSSGVFWDPRALSPELQHYIFLFNPIAMILDCYRQLLLYQQAIDIAHLALIISAAAAANAGLLYWIRRHETWLALRVLS